MYDIFISYSHQDKAAAFNMVDALENEGFPCWIDKRDIQISADFGASVTQAIRNARIVLALLSEKSNASKYVSKELSLATKHGIDILPVVLEEFTPSPKMEFWLSALEILGPLNSFDELKSRSTEWLHLYFKGLDKKDPVSDTSEKHNGNMLDIYDKDMDFVGHALRNKVHQLVLWHKTFHCWCYHNDGGDALLWVQRRSNSKKDFPGKLDITVGRHLMSVETDREAAERVSQEIGTSVVFDDLHYVGVRTHSERDGDFVNKEFNSVFLYETPYSLGELNPDVNEVAGVLQIRAEDMLALFEQQVDSIPSIELTFDKGHNLRIGTVCRNDFVPHDYKYYKEICSCAINLCSKADDDTSAK